MRSSMTRRLPAQLRRLLPPLAVVLAAFLIASAADAPVPTPIASAATCSAYANQAAAQRAHDTRDADGDGIYCESLPCPCARGTGGGSAPPAPSHPAASCVRPPGTVVMAFSAARYPHIRAHWLRALRHGWPRVLVLNRPGAGARRERLLSDMPTRPGMDRDEYPPAVGRGMPPEVIRGAHPRGWKADVAYVPSGENRSQGAVMGAELRPYCNGTRFRYGFR
jgi:hypothetical protein